MQHDNQHPVIAARFGIDVVVGAAPVVLMVAHVFFVSARTRIEACVE